MSFLKYLKYLNPLGGLLAFADLHDKSGPLGEAVEGMKGPFESFVNSQTGGVTARDDAMMQYQTQEREAAQDWTAQREDTEYQRRVADMKAAGINPMMAAGSGGVSSSSSGSAAPSGAPAASLSEIMQMMLLPMQKKVMQAQANNLNSQAENRDKLTPAQIEDINQRIQESIAREHEAWKRADEIDYKIQLYISETLLADAQAHLAEVNAQDLQALRESRIALNEARTQEAKASATLAYWNSMYQKGLISEGMCQKVAAKIAAETTLADKQGKLLDEQSKRQAIENSVKSGHWSDEISQSGNGWDKMLMYLDRATSTLGNVLSLHN